MASGSGAISAAGPAIIPAGRPVRRLRLLSTGPAPDALRDAVSRRDSRRPYTRRVTPNRVPPRSGTARRHATGTSIWLLPAGAEADRLRRTIADLADRLGTARFEPHVTLMPGFEGPESVAAEAARELASSAAGLRVDLGAPVVATDYWRAFVLPLRPSAALSRLRLRAERLLGLRPEGPFRPHLSLVYAEPWEMDPDVARSPSAARLGGLTLRIEAVAAVRTRGPAEGWVRLDDGAVATTPAP